MTALGSGPCVTSASSRLLSTAASPRPPGRRPRAGAYVAQLFFIIHNANDYSASITNVGVK